jgi:hypothetical protein
MGFRIEMLSNEQRAYLWEATERYRQALPDSPADAYLSSRGLSGPGARQFGLGYVKDPARGHEMFRGRLAIPYMRFSPWRGWSVASIRFRSLDQSGSKYMTVTGDTPRLYNTRALTLNTERIAITEGECLRGDAEVLTPLGWVRFDEYQPGTQVAQYEMSGDIRFVTPTAYIKKNFTGNLIERENGQRYYHLSTPGHRVPAFGGKREPYKFTTAEEGFPHSASIPRAGLLDGPGIPLTDSEIRLRIAVSADAAIRTTGYSDTYMVFGFKKQRKVERLRKILADVGIQPSDTQIAGGYTSICFLAGGRKLTRELPEEWLIQASIRQRRMILDELIEWDGNRVPNRDQTEYSSKHLSNAQWVQTLAHTAGMTSTIISRRNEHGSWYKVSILHNKRTSNWQSLQDYQEVYHDGDVYCVSVPSTAFLVRMGCCISVTGNCDAITAELCGLPAVGVPGVQTWKPYYRELFLGYREVLILADGDEPGVLFANTVAKALPNARVIQMPQTLDVNDVYLKEGREGLLRRLK